MYEISAATVKGQASSKPVDFTQDWDCGDLTPVFRRGAGDKSGRRSVSVWNAFVGALHYSANAAVRRYFCAAV